jgi:hypothetical protein
VVRAAIGHIELLLSPFAVVPSSLFHDSANQALTTVPLSVDIETATFQIKASFRDGPVMLRDATNPSPITRSCVEYVTETERVLRRLEKRLGAQFVVSSHIIKVTAQIIQLDLLAKPSFGGSFLKCLAGVRSRFVAASAQHGKQVLCCLLSAVC